MQSRLADFEKADTVLLAISKDSVEENADTVKKLNLGFSVLSDPDLEVTKEYDLLHAGASIDGGDIARPAVFIVDRDGVVRWRQLTDNWRVRARSDALLEQVQAIP